jgi:hypothetical protein
VQQVVASHALDAVVTGDAEEPFAAALPRRLLSPSLPVPSIRAAPASTRAPTLAGRVNVT